MTDLEQAIQMIEHGLLKPRGKQKGPRKTMELSKRMEYYKMPGFSIALIEQGKLVWAKGYGLVEAGGEKPVTEKTIFQAASISKPVTAMTALHLVEAGLLDLDGDVNDVLRSWKVPKNKFTRASTDGAQPKVTLRGLLSHTAGMTVRGYLGYHSDEPLPNLQQILDGKPPAHSKPVRVGQTPGTEFRYSGGGYVVAQQVMEDVTGRPLASLAKEFIFNKIGMAHSTFESRLPKTFLSRTATAHRKTGEWVPGKWHIYPEQAPASLWTTPSDLACLIIEVMESYKGESNLVLSKKMTRQMLTPQMGIGGLGFLIIKAGGRTRFEHPGWNEGFHSLLIGDLTTGQGMVWMTNGENGRHLGWEVTRGLADVFGWRW